MMKLREQLTKLAGILINIQTMFEQTNNKAISFSKRGCLFFTFIFSFLILNIFQINFFNAGDASEFLVASNMLSVPHPSGFPGYILILKISSFIPFGNLGFKAGIVSCFFGALCAVSFVYILSDIKVKLSVAFCMSVTLVFGFSFFTQSIIIKYYSLNTFLISIIFIMGYKSLIEYKAEYQYTIFFLLGMATILHHLVFFIGLSMLFISVYNFKNFIRRMPVSVLYMFSGFILNVYLLIRSKEGVPYYYGRVVDLKSFLDIFLRRQYGEASTGEIIKRGFDFSDKLFHAVNNVTDLLIKEYGVLFLLLFFLGMIVFFLKDKKMFFYWFLSFLGFTVFLGLITYSRKDLSVRDIFIVGHQYYLPCMFFYMIPCAILINHIYDIVKSQKMYKILSVFLLVIPIALLFNRTLDSFQAANYIMPNYIKDSLFTVPVKSYMIMTGDIDGFSSWYMKSVGRFRDDICVLTMANAKDKHWNTDMACNIDKYGEYYGFPQLAIKVNMKHLAVLMKNHRVFSSSPIKESKNLSDLYEIEPNVVNLIMYPKLFYYEDVDKIVNYQKTQRKENDKYIHWRGCVEHSVDDMFNYSICLNYIFNRLLHMSDNDDYEKLYTNHFLYQGHNFVIKYGVGPTNAYYNEQFQQLYSRNDPERFQLYEEK